MKDDPVEHPMASAGDELDNLTVFDHAFIPWKYVFHIGNPDHAKLYPQRVFDWLHYHAIIRQMVRTRGADFGDMLRPMNADPFGTMKAHMGATHFPTKTLPKVAAEMTAMPRRIRPGMRIAVAAPRIYGDPYDRGSGTPAVVYESMANGQVVLVTTEPLDGGLPVRSVFFVAEEDPAKAKAIIASMMAPNERVEAWGPLPEAAVKALGLKPGDFTHG